MNFLGFMNPQPQQQPSTSSTNNIRRNTARVNLPNQQQQSNVGFQQQQQPNVGFNQQQQQPNVGFNQQQQPNVGFNQQNQQRSLNNSSRRNNQNNQQVLGFLNAKNSNGDGEEEEISQEEELIEQVSAQQQQQQNQLNQQNKNKNKPILNVITNTLGITNTSSKPTIEMNISNSTKRHYFIGYVFNQKDVIDALMNVQRQLIKDYKLRDYYLNFNNKFMSRFIYLGYLTPEVANKYMENMVSPVCNQLSKKMKPLKCRFTKIKPKFDKPVNWFSVFFEDENNYIKNVIIPFLDKEVIKPIFPKRYTNYQPLVDVIHFKGNSGITRGKNITVPVPHIQFTMDHISLISAKPTQTKMGYQAIHDNLSYEEEHKYYFPFQG